MNRLPVWITLGVGWFLVADYFVPHPVVSNLGQRINTWVPIVAAVALALGAVSLFQLHAGRILRRHPQWFYSSVTLVSMVVTVIIGLWPGETSAVAFDWIYDFLFAPLRATMFALLAFYLASAAYRAFRIRSKEASLLFAAAFLVMLGNVPWVGNLIELLPRTAGWIMDVPMTAAMRAIQIGVGLGLVVLSLRILLGRDRSYLGDGR